MEIKKKSFMSFVLIFVMIFSSLGSFASGGAESEKNYSVTIGDYEYFSDEDDEYNLSRVKLDTNGNRTGDIKNDITSGSAIHLMINDRLPNNEYLYYLLKDNESSGMYRLDASSVDNTTYNASPSAITVKDTDDDNVDFLEKSISHFFLTKGNDVVKKDIMYFIESSSEEGISLLREIIFTDASNAELTNMSLKVKNIKPITDAKGIITSIHFTEITGSGEEHQKLDLSTNIVSDIPLESFTIKRKVTGGEDVAVNGTLNLYPGDEVSLTATGINPINTTDVKLKWELKNVSPESQVTLESQSEDSTKATLKILDTATSKTTATMVVSDNSIDNSSVPPVEISIVVNARPNPITKVEFNTEDIDLPVELEETESITVPLKLTFTNADAEIPDIGDEIKKIIVEAVNSQYIDVEKVYVEATGKVSVKITGRKSTGGLPTLATAEINGVLNSKVSSPEIIVTPLINPLNRIEFTNPSSKTLTVEKEKSLEIPLNLFGVKEDLAITDEENGINRIAIGISEEDSTYVDVKPMLDVDGKAFLKITGLEDTEVDSQIKITVSVDGVAGSVLDPVFVRVSPLKNPLVEVKFVATDLGEIINLKKGNTQTIPLELIGENPNIEVTDKVNEIKKIIVESTDDKYISVELDSADSENVSVKITAKEVTPDGVNPRATVSIKDIDNSEDKSSIIKVTEVPKPNIRIKPVYDNNDKVIDTTNPIEIVQGKTLGFELEIEKDGKFEKIDPTLADKITWSIEGTTAKVENIKGIKTTVEGLKAGTATLTASYNFDGERVETAKINLTIITNEYADHDQWTDEKTPTTVSSTKIWTVNFNQSINEDTINSRTVFVKRRLGPDSESLYDDTITYIGDNDKSLKIKPIIPYAPGEYFLYIENVKDNNGNILKNNIKMKFTVR